MITFVGTLAANVATVVIVGVAIITERKYVSPPTGHPHSSLGEVAVTALVGLVLYSGLLYLNWRSLRSPERQIRIIAGGLTAVVAVALVILLLIVIGYAAGIKLPARPNAYRAPPGWRFAPPRLE